MEFPDYWMAPGCLTGPSNQTVQNRGMIFLPKYMTPPIFFICLVTSPFIWTGPQGMSPPPPHLCPPSPLHIQLSHLLACQSGRGNLISTQSLPCPAPGKPMGDQWKAKILRRNMLLPSALSPANLDPGRSLFKMLSRRQVYN